MTGPPRGRLIVIEGIDGAGKSTLVAALARALSADGVDVVTSAEPTDGPHGRKIRELAATGRHDVTPQQEAELFLLDRRDHVDHVIKPALAAGRTLVLDRYYYSTMAYQGARGLDPAQIERRNRAFAPEPDLLVILELPVQEALERITQKRGSAPDHFEGEAYLEKVDQGFKTIRRPNMLRLDARTSTEEMVGRILAGLERL